MILELGNHEQSSFVLPSGQSGHVFSPHYRDQTPIWRSGGYIRPFDAEEEMKNWPTLTLKPSREEGAAI